MFARFILPALPRPVCRAVAVDNGRRCLASVVPSTPVGGEIPSGWKGVQRFYDSCGVRPVNAEGEEVHAADADAYQIIVEGRELRTNGMNDLLLPTRGLAVAVAGEFAKQGNMIHPPSTPLYNLACLALDTYGPNQQVERPHSKHELVTETEKLQTELADYLETDTVVYRASLESQDPGEAILRRRQDKHYDPLVKWFEDTYGGPLAVVEGLADAIHPQCVYEPLREYVAEANKWEKAAISVTLGTVKSTVITMAFLSRFITVAEAFEACRVEEEFQIDENGMVEDGHDTSRAQDRAKLGAVSTFKWLLVAP